MIIKRCRDTVFYITIFYDAILYDTKDDFYYDFYIYILYIYVVYTDRNIITQKGGDDFVSFVLLFCFLSEFYLLPYN